MRGNGFRREKSVWYGSTMTTCSLRRLPVRPVTTVWLSFPVRWAAPDASLPVSPGDLIGRAADVMLKERRPLVLVVRETPLSTIHLRNLTLLSECGAVVLPASPSFYSRPADIEALCDTVAVRAVRMLGVASEGYEWGAEEE